MRYLFRKYINSTLSPDEFREITGFIRDKKNESIVSQEIKLLWDKVFRKDTGLPEPNSELMKKIKEIIHQERFIAFKRKTKIYLWGLRIAAVLIIGLLINMFFFSSQVIPGQFQSKENLQTITTPYGARTNITLPDGSTVWLNSGTTLSYPPQFDEIRQVNLDGEAYFKVVKKSQSFIVLTNYGEVEVKGTSFNVKAFSDDNSFETTLVDGIVSLKDKNTKNEITLSPGQQAVQTSNGFVCSNVDPRFYTSWKEGKLIFSKEPFCSLVKKLERWYNVKIEYNDPGLNQIWYTGTIEMESISEVMEMISKASPVSCSFNNKTRVFTIKSK